MRTASFHHLPWWTLRAVLIGVIGIAIVLMHSLTATAHGAQRGSMPAMVMAQSSMAQSSMSVASMSAASMARVAEAAEAGSDHHRTHGHRLSIGPDSAPSTEHLGSSDSCVLGHHCVFVRGDDAPLPPVIIFLLFWLCAAPPALLGLSPALRGRLDRPPPWTQPTHLSLSVIRC